MASSYDEWKKRYEEAQAEAETNAEKAPKHYGTSNLDLSHEYKSWSDWLGNVNMSDITSGETNREYSGTTGEIRKTSRKDNLSSDIGQAVTGAMSRQGGDYRSALATLGLGVAGLLHGDNNYQPEVGSALWRLQEGAEAATKAGAQQMEDSKYGRGWLGRFTMDLTSDAVDLAGDQLLNLVAPGAGMAAMAARSFGGSAEEQREQGKSISTQFFKGLKSAAIEYGTEKFAGIGGRSIEGGGYIDSLLSRAEESIVRKGGNAFLTKLGFAFLSEGAEEMMSDWLNPLADKFLAGVVKGDYDIEDFPSFAEVAYDGLIGGALGLLGGAREGIKAQSDFKAAGGTGADYANFLADKRAKTKAEVKRAKETKRAQLKAIFDYATNHAEQAMDRAKEVKANEAPQSPVEAQSASVQQVTPEAPPSAVKQEAGEFNEKPAPKTGELGSLSKDEQYQRIQNIERQAQQQQDLADRTAYKPEKEYYAQEAERLFKKATQLRAEYGFDERGKETANDKSVTEQAQELIKADERTRETGELDYDPSKVPEEILKEKERLEQEAKKAEPEPTFEAPEVGRIVDSPEAANEAAQAKKEWDEVDWAREEARKKESESPEKQVFEEPKATKPKETKKSRAKKAKTGTDILAEVANATPKEPRKPRKKKEKTAQDILLEKAKKGEFDAEEANELAEIQREAKAEPDYKEKKAEKPQPEQREEFEAPTVARDTESEEKQKKSRSKKTKSGAEILEEQAATNKKKVKATKEEASNGMAFKHRKAMSKVRVAENDTVVAHIDAADASDKSVRFDGNKVVSKKNWPFLGKKLGDHVTVNGKLYIIDSIEHPATASDKLAEAAEKNKGKAQRRLERKARFENFVHEIKNTQDHNAKAREIAHDAIKLAALKSAGFEIEDGVVKNDPRLDSRYVSDSKYLKARLEKSKKANVAKDLPVAVVWDGSNFKYTPRGKANLRKADLEVLNSHFNKKDLKKLFGKDRGSIYGYLTGDGKNLKFVVDGSIHNGNVLDDAKVGEHAKSLGLELSNGDWYVGRGKLNEASAEQESERRMDFIGDRGVSIKERLDFAKATDEIDYLDAVDRFVDNFLRYHVDDNGDFKAKDIKELDAALRNFMDNYEAAHDYTWDIIDDEVVKNWHGKARQNAVSEIIKDMESSDEKDQLVKEGFANRTLHKLTRDLSESDIEALVQKKLESIDFKNGKPENWHFSVIPENGYGSPYEVYCYFNKSDVKEPFTIRVMHTDAKSENGVRIDKFKTQTLEKAANIVANEITEYEHGDKFAQEAKYKLTRRDIQKKLSEQNKAPLDKDGYPTDYVGDYKVEDFDVKITYRRGKRADGYGYYDIDITDSAGKHYSDYFDERWMYDAKTGKRKGNYDPLQKAATDVEDVNFETGEKHVFDMLNPELAANIFVRFDKGTATVLMPGYKEQTIWTNTGKDGALEEKKVMVPGFNATKQTDASAPSATLLQAASEAVKTTSGIEDDLPFRKNILDKAFDPDVVEVDGVLYDVGVGYGTEYTYKNGKPTSNAMYYYVTYHDGSNNLEADVNIKNAATPEQAVRYAHEKNLFHDYSSDESIKAHQKHEAKKIAKQIGELNGKEEQSGRPAGTGGAEKATGADKGTAGSSVGQVSGGGARRGTVLSLNTTDVKTREASTLAERNAADIVRNGTLNKIDFEIVQTDGAYPKEYGLTTLHKVKNSKGETVWKTVVKMADNLPDGDVMRKLVAGHEKIHGWLRAIHGDYYGNVCRGLWQTFRSLHPAEAQEMETWFTKTKRGYMGEDLGKSLDELDSKKKGKIAGEIIAHFASGTVRVKDAERAAVADSYQKLLQDFLIKSGGFKPGMFNGVPKASDFFSIKDEVDAFAKSKGDAEEGSFGGNADENASALSADDDAEWAKMKAEEEGGKVRDLREEKLQRDRKRDKTEINSNKAYEQAQAKTKEEVTAEQAARDLEEAKRIFGKDFEKVQESAKNFSEIKTRFDTDEFKRSKDKHDKAARTKIEKIRDAYDSAAKSGNMDRLFSLYESLKDDPNLSNFYDEDVQEDIDNFRELVDENLDTYNEGAAPYAAARTMQKMAHKFVKANEYQQTLKKMNETLRGSKNGILRKIGKSDKLAASIARALMRWQINPDTVFKMIDAFDKGNAGEGYKLAKELQEAHREKYRVLREARAKFDEASDLKGYQDFAFGKQTVKDYSGREWDMRSALSVIKAIDTIRSTSGKKLGGTDGFGVMDSKGNVEFIDMKDVDAIKLYESLKSGLSDVAIKYGELATEAFNDVKEPLRAKYKQNNGVDIGMVGDEDARLGDKKGIEKAVYSPLSYVDKNGNVYQFDIAKQETYNNIPRFLRERSDAGGTYILIKPYTEVTGKYFEQVSNYLAYSTFNEKMRGLGKGSSYESGLGNTLADAFGKDMGNWYRSYVEDLGSYHNEDDVEGVNSLLRQGRQQLQQGALLFSVSVPMKQISSYWAASGILHPDSLIKNYRIKLLKPKNSSDAATMLASRAMGNLEQSAAEAAKDAKKWLGKLKYSSKFIELAANAINQMDYNTVSNLLSATEYDVLKYQFGGDKSVIGTDEYKTAVEEKFQDVVDRSQPNFDKQMRAEYGRTDNEVIRMLSMFRTQQTQNLNLLATAIGEYQASKGTANQAKATETLKQTIAGQAASAFSLSMLTILADMLLHRQKKYEDEETEELDMSKVLTRLGINAIEASSGTMWFGDTIAKWAIDRISGGKTKEFYGVNMGVISTVSDILENFENFMQNPSRSNAKYCAGNIATLMGIPLNNAYAMLNSAIMYGKDVLGFNEGDYDDILKYLDAQAKAAKKEEEKAAKAAAKAAKKSGADVLADTAKQNGSQSELNSTEEQKTAEVSTYLKKPYNALVEAGMTPERSQYVLDFMDTDNNDSIKQSEMWAFYKDNPDYEDYVIAMWNSYGYKTTWEAYKAKHK